jgi:hypothetical protein
MLYLDIEDDVDGAGEVGSLESRGSDELKFAMIRSIPALHLELFYNSYRIKMKVISIINNSASLCHFCIDIKEKEGSKRKRGVAT